MSDDLIGAIQQILILGKGDQGRLEYLLDILQKGKTLSNSDKRYLQLLVPMYLGSKDPESHQSNAEHVIEQLQDEINQLHEKINKIQRKGFEKYVGRKAVLFFVTVFVGWNVFQTYIQTILYNFIQNDIPQYVFPLNWIENYLNYGQAVWFVFLILLISWPFIGSIYLTKFIKSRKISNNL